MNKQCLLKMISVADGRPIVSILIALFHTAPADALVLKRIRVCAEAVVLNKPCLMKIFSY